MNKEELQKRMDNIAKGFVVTDNKYTGGICVQNEKLEVPAICGFGKDREIDCNNYFFILETIKKCYPEFTFTEEKMSNIEKIKSMVESIKAYNENFSIFEILDNKIMQEYQHKMKLGNSIFFLITNLTLASIKIIEKNTYTDDEGCSYNSLVKINLGA